MPRYTGGCHCGAVRITLVAEPKRVGLCHCLDCRKRQGSALHFFAVFPAESATVTGETRQYHWLPPFDLEHHERDRS